MRRMFGFALLLFSVLSFSFIAARTAGAGDASSGRPNVLLLFVDNLGYGDVGCYGNRAIKTPNIDQLATQGVRCTDFYIGSPSCTPSRGAILSGRHPERTGLNWQLRAEESFGIGLPLREKLIPEYLQPLGYAAAAYGKWNIGFGEGARPTDRGFDEFLGHASGNIDYYTYVYNGWNDLRRGAEEATSDAYATDLWADSACDFIARHTEQPFFIYLPFNAPHFPMEKNTAPGVPVIWQAPDEAFAAYGWSPSETDEKRRYYATVTALDTAIGRVLGQIDKLKLRDNTLVIWLSDNGAFMLPGRGLEVASNAPLREGGVTCYEGGIRVPAIVRWPGRIEPGTTCAEPLWSMDLLPMIVQAAGGKLPDDRKLDGRDPTATLTGKAPSPHDALYWRWRDYSAMRRGNHKLVRSKPNAPWELYDLASDLGEQQNLAASQPELVAELDQMYEAWLDDVQGDTYVKATPTGHTRP